MKVRFKQTWFGPSVDGMDFPDKLNSRGDAIPGTSRHGVRYKKGVVYDIPESMSSVLPKSVEIMEATVKGKKIAAQKANDGLSLKDFDHEREVAKRMEEAMQRAGV